MFDFNETIVVVTGGVKGIGFECVQFLLETGIKNCVILDIDKTKGEEIEKILNYVYGEGRVKYFDCDVSKMADFEAVMLKVVDVFGRFDVLINNAGIIDEIDWEKTVDVNIKGVINGVNLAMKFMSKNNGGKGGTVINMSSICGLQPFSSIPVYSATKFAVNGITQCMGTQFYYNKTGVRVMALCLGVTQTDLLYYVDVKTEDNELNDLRMKELTASPLQEPENVAEALVEILMFGGNGTVWISEGGEHVYDIYFPSRTELRKMY